jgi:methyl-accepting chemotaxis protein
MFEGKRITVLGVVFIALGLLSTAAVIATSRWIEAAQAKLEAAHTRQYNSYLLADELRQSSDDLTRLARTYVVTGDPSYESQYMDILAIRNGQKERPADYHRIYWDFAAAGRPVSPGSGVTRALEDLMRDEGFTGEEFELLAEAKANSDGLVALEVRAMNAVKGNFADAAGNYTVKGEPDMELARNLMHSREYHQFKADIMAPIHEFLGSPEKRISGQITALKATYEQARTAAHAATIMLMLVMAGIGWLVLSAMLKPLSRLTGTLRAFYEGDEASEVPDARRRDEFGELARGVERTIESARRSRRQGQELQAIADAASLGDFSGRMEASGNGSGISASANALMEQLDMAFSEISDMLRRIAKGDLTKRGSTQLEGRFAEVLAHADTARAGLETIVSRARSGADTLDSRSAEMAETMDVIQRATESNAAALEETTAAATELTESIRAASDSASKVRSAADSARGNTHAVNSGFSDVISALEEIEATSEEILKIVELIDSIAFQTNLLALNAGVEAARAGQSGGGFAVVANEVRALAQRTSEAAKQIGDLSASSSAKITEGSQLAGRVGEQIREVSSEIAGISEVIASVSDEAAQQASSMNEVSAALASLDQNTQRNAEMVHNSSGTAAELTREARALRQTVSSFETGTAKPGSSLRLAG